MHKYRPRVHVFCIPKGHPLITKKGQQQLFNKEMRTVEGLKRIANGPFDYKTFLFEVVNFDLMCQVYPRDGPAVF